MLRRQKKKFVSFVLQAILGVAFKNRSGSFLKTGGSAEQRIKLIILANFDNLSWGKHLVGRGVVIFAEELWLCRGPREQTAGNVISSLCMLYLDMFFHQIQVFFK